MWKELWIIMLVLAFVTLGIAILFTFIWDIPNLIDELSGRKAKRQIKMLHELNSSTSTFDKLSTNEIYSGISSGTLLNDELVNTDEEEDATSFLAEEGEESTSFISEDGEECTSYLGESDSNMNHLEDKGLKIEIIEEQSSLG